MSLRRFTAARHVVLAGLALSLLASASAPFLSTHDADAARHKSRNSSSQVKKGRGARLTTQTFSENRGMLIPNTEQPGGVPANPYPSTISVSGYKKGQVTDVNLTLRGFTHEIPPDVDIMLVKEGPNPVAVQVMGDAGDLTMDRVARLTLDDEASKELPFFERLSEGSFKPTDHDQGGIDDESFPAPAPALTGTRLAAFDGLDPNGTWRLYVVDARNIAGGSIDGWELTLQVQEQPSRKKR